MPEWGSACAGMAVVELGVSLVRNHHLTDTIAIQNV